MNNSGRALTLRLPVCEKGFNQGDNLLLGQGMLSDKMIGYAFESNLSENFLCGSHYLMKSSLYLSLQFTDLEV